MKTRLLNNFGLKVGSLILAFIAWLIVVNVNDPTITRTIQAVSVNVTNTSYVESLSMAAKLESASSTVSVRVSGRRSVVEPLTKDTVKAEADLTQIVNMAADPIMVPVSVSIPGISKENITVTPGNIEISLEEMASSDFLIQANAGETRPNNRSYVVGSLTADPESITITGPESLIQIIDRVVAPVNVSLLTADTYMESEIVIYDKNGDQFTETQMDSLKFSKTDGTVGVTVDLWRVVPDVGFNIEVGGTPGEGYKVGEVTTTPTVISVAGTDEALYTLSEDGNSITIPSELITLNGETEDATFKIDLTTILPDGIRLSESTSSTTLLVNVEILPYDSVTLDIASAAITQEKLGANLGVIFTNTKFRVRIQGSDENLLKVNEETVKASIDFSAYTKAGNYQDVEVKITVPEGCTLVTPVTIDFTIEQLVDPNAESESESTSESESAAP